MHWLQDLDVSLLRFINGTLSNSFFDALMPFASGNRYFFGVVFFLGLLLIWKGGVRGRLCALMLLLIVWPGDTFVCNTIKHAIARPRPFIEHTDLHQPSAKNRNDMASDEPRTIPEATAAAPVRRTGYNSMPSSHAANWFAATMIFFIYFRRSWLIMLPLALLVSFSRIYNGVHYPSDVLAGMVLGAGYAVAGMWAINRAWQWVGQKWFPLWWQRVPSLVNVAGGRQKAESGTRSLPTNAPAARPVPTGASSAIDQHWLRLGYILIVVLLFAKLFYIHSRTIELTGDEAYQWVWSKHPSLSYISKPPLIAYVQWIGTHLWGDNEFGVRFFSPVMGAVVGFLLLRFFAREVSARTGFFLLLIVQATPLAALGTILLTIDPLLVLFWTAAMISGWRAIQPGAHTRSWIWTGIWMGFGLLSKYTAMLQLLSWCVLFALWKPAREQLRRPGPYLALAINLLFSTPILIWNMQHGWTGMVHLVNHNARLNTEWNPTIRYLIDFVREQFLALNPVFFIAMIWAAIAFWRHNRKDLRLVYLFSMGAPLFVVYLLYALRVRILPNWTAPAMLPLLCLMTVYWHERWMSGVRAVKYWLATGLTVGLIMVLLMHNFDLIKHVAGQPLPPKPDPTTRLRAHRESARVIGEVRDKLLAEGKPTFIIGGHYQVASLFNFYLPEARTNVVHNQLVYYQTTEIPENQYSYWPGYQETRKGQNAIYVRELSMSPLVRGWTLKWLAGETNLERSTAKSLPPPEILLKEFESVTDLGQFNVYYRGRVFHIFQIFECRNLR